MLTKGQDPKNPEYFLIISTTMTFFLTSVHVCCLFYVFLIDMLNVSMDTFS